MKLLYITSLSGHRINSFMRSAIVAANEENLDMTIACNMTNADKILYEQDCKQYGIKMAHIDFDRNPLSRMNMSAKKQLTKLIRENNFDIIHCNTPIGGVLGRICGKEQNVPYIIYMAHGFHFWHGAPIKNWLLYYPVEKMLAYYTDLIITINQDDYILAKEKLKAKKIEYVHGVGVDLSKFDTKKNVNPPDFRNSICCKSEDILLLSVGELNDNKNQSIVIRAMSKLKKDKVHYIVAGQGGKKKELLNLAEKLGVKDRVHLLGYRSDVLQIYREADIFVFPSKREGLPSSIMEAMASGKPCVVSRIRGATDLIEEGKGGYFFDPSNVDELVSVLEKTLNQKEYWSKMGAYNSKKVVKFGFDVAVEELRTIYREAISFIKKQKD